MQAAPKISVLLPIYNAARYLREAVESLRTQTHADFEIVAVDDGSTDESAEILRTVARTEPRLQVESRPNTGIVGALNDGLALARGEFIARMDADDVSLPRRFSAQLDFLAQHPDCVALGSDVEFTDPEGRPLSRRRPAQDHAEILRQLLDGNGGALVHPSVMFRRAAVERIGGYREHYSLEDLDIYLRLTEHGTLANLPDVLLRYRQHLGSINYTCGDREKTRRKVVTPWRERRGLSELPPYPQEFDSRLGPSDWRRNWAYQAAGAGNRKSARANARLAVVGGLFDPRNWKCLKYTHTVV